MTERYAHALYCDDIRHEIGGKTTYVGTYHADLVAFGKPPIVLPKLCVVVWVSTPTNNPFSKVHVKLSQNESVIAATDVELPPRPEDVKLENRPRMTVIATLTLSPFPIEEEGTLRTIVEADGEEFRAGGLVLRFEQPAELEDKSESEKE